MVFTEDANGLVPPITYGETPAGVPESDPAVPLILGESYKVALYCFVDGPDEHDEYWFVGYAVFVP